MKKFKRLAAICILAVFLALPLQSALAAAPVKSKDYTYDVRGNNATIIKYTGSAANLKIPSKFGRAKVVAISEYAFANNTKLTSVTIPDTVKTIGNGAFFDCTKLKKVDLSKNLKEIPWHAFSGDTALKSISIPESVTKIGLGAFSGCKALTSIDIPASVTDIDRMVFWTEKLSDSFKGRVPSKLTIYAPKGSRAQQYAINYGIKYAEAGTPVSEDTQFPVDFDYSVTKSGKAIINSYHGNASGITIPAEIGGRKVEEISVMAFMNTKFKTADIEDGIKTIGTAAFAKSALTSIKMPDSVTKIGPAAFQYALKLKTVTLSKKLKNIDYLTFANTALTKIDIPNGVKSIGAGAFALCKQLKTVKIPASVKSIDRSAFGGSPNVVIYGAAGSYAQKYAKQYGFPFKAVK